MKASIQFFLLAFTTLVLAQTTRAQQGCSCEEVKEYHRKRDIDTVDKYTYVNLWQESEELAKNPNKRCQAFSFQLKALVQLKHDQFIDALYSLEREKSILDSLKCKSSNYQDHYVTYGDYYIAVGEFKLASEAYGKALKLAQKSGNKAQLSKVYLGLSTAFARLNNPEKSHYYVNQAYPLLTNLPDNANKVDDLLELSARYVKLYRLTKKQFYLDSANNAVGFGYDLARKIQYGDSYLKAYNLLEDKAYYDGNYRVALLYFDSALNLTNGSVYLEKERGAIFGDMTDIYLELKRYDKAYQFADSNLVYARKSGNPYDLQNAYELLYNCAKLSGDYERALVLYQDLTLLKDSVERINNDKAYSQLQEKYHRVRKEKSDAEYEQDQRLLEKQKEIGNLKRRLIIVGIVILTLMGAYVFMVFRQRGMKSRHKRLEVQRRLQEARINPDFIYQALNKLQHKADAGQEDAKKQLQAYSRLLKQILESTFNDFMTLDHEMEFLSLYMNLEKESRKLSFDYHFEVDPMIDPQNTCIPTMLLQPFIESTIVDGFKNLPHPGKLTISFTIHNLNELSIVIRDNGKGLKAIDSTRASEIINDRIYLLNELNKSQSSYLIREHSQGGVSIEIFIPLITKAYAEEIRKNSL